MLRFWHNAVRSANFLQGQQARGEAVDQTLRARANFLRSWAGAGKVLRDCYSDAASEHAFQFG